MPDLRIQTAKDNGDLPKDHGQDKKDHGQDKKDDWELAHEYESSEEMEQLEDSIHSFFRQRSR